MIDLNTVQEAIKLVSHVRVTGDLDLHKQNIQTFKEIVNDVMLATDGSIDLYSMTALKNYEEIVAVDVPASHVNKASANTKSSFSTVLTNLVKSTTQDMKFCKTIGHTINSNPGLHLEQADASVLVDVSLFNQLNANDRRFLCCMLASGKGTAKGVIYLNGNTAVEYSGEIVEIEVRDGNRLRYVVRAFATLRIGTETKVANWDNATYTFETKGE